MPLSSSTRAACLILGVLLLAAGCDRQSATPAQPADAAADASVPGAPDRSHKGEAAPALTFKGPGGALALGGPQPKPRLVNLWATWCPPCREELPALHRLSARQDITVVAVSQDSGGAGNPGMEAKVAAYWSAQHFGNWGLWLDPDNTASTAYHVGNLPMTVLYDTKGREVWRVLGPRNWTDAASANLLAEAGRG